MAEGSIRISGGQKQRQFRMWIPERVKTELDAAAEREGASLKDFFLAGAYERLRRRPVMKPEGYEGFVELHEQLRRAGVNLNTLIRSGLVAEMSGGSGPNETDFANVHSEITDAAAAITKFLSEFRVWSCSP